jgi:hypothetical protein
MSRQFVRDSSRYQELMRALVKHSHALDSDVVFGVRPSLVAEFPSTTDPLRRVRRSRGMVQPRIRLHADRRRKFGPGS